MDPVDPVDDPTDGPAASPPEKRIGDRERREIDARLRQAHDDGVLTLAEYDERVAQCWAARTRRDLDALIADLPDPAPDEASLVPDPPPATPTRSRRARTGRPTRAASGSARRGCRDFPPRGMRPPSTAGGR